MLNEQAKVKIHHNHLYLLPGLSNNYDGTFDETSVICKALFVSYLKDRVMFIPHNLDGTPLKYNEADKPISEVREYCKRHKLHMKNPLELRFRISIITHHIKYPRKSLNLIYA